MRSFFLMIVVCFSLAGCSSPYSTSGEQMYLKARNGENLVISPPLSQSQLSQFYDLPSVDTDPRVNIAPPMLSIVEEA